MSDSVRRLDDFQSSATTQGRAFEQLVATQLRISGWTIVSEHERIAGAEIDIIADDPTGQRWWIECKGSWRGGVPGLIRGDTTKKAVGVAAYLSTLPERQPYMVVASHLPKPGSVGDHMLTVAVEQGWIRRVACITNPFGPSADDIDDPTEDDE